MRLLLLALCVFSVALAATDRNNSFLRRSLLHREPPPPEPANPNRRLVLSRTITQKLDHFDDANTATWEMRYFSNDEHYVPGGPIFIYIGGEWTISYGSILGGHIYDMAKEMNGHLFYTEHRYYGQSHPTT